LATQIKYRSDFHHTVYVVNVALIAISLPLSKFTQSVFEISLALLWILSGFSFRIVFRFFKMGNIAEAIWHTLEYIANTIRHNAIEKTKLFLHNKPALIAASVFFLYIIGLVYTSNFDFAFQSLRIKLPLLLFPLIFGSMPKISDTEFKQVMLWYLAAVLTGVAIGFYLFFDGEFLDVRELSPFINPIRFSLNITFGIFIMLWFVFKEKGFSILQRAGFVIAMIMFLSFLIILESITGISTIIITVFVLAGLTLFITRSRLLKGAIVFLIMVLPASMYIYINQIVHEVTTAPPLNVELLDQYTSHGNPYKNDTNSRIENGKYVDIYVCEKELREAWNKRSRMDYNGLTGAGLPISNTLKRYLTSKNLRKDADGVSKLSNDDIRLIENGIANWNYINDPGIKSRLLKIIYGFQSYNVSGDPSGNSILQRIEYIKGALLLVKRNPLFGVGTGDMEDALLKEYQIMKSKLKPKFFFHAHNQFLTITITFGVVGLMWFLFALFYPPLKLRHYRDYFFLIFFIIMLASMLTDDTLDTHSGVSLFAFFYSFLLLGRKRIKNIVS